MDSRVKTLIGAVALFAVIIVVVLIGQSGGDDESDEPATAERQDKPEVEIPEGDPPEELVIEDLEEGDGTRPSRAIRSRSITWASSTTTAMSSTPHSKGPSRSSSCLARALSSPAGTKEWRG